MSGDDPILDARTMDALAAAIDAVYHLGLPTDMPPGTFLAELWASGVHVIKDPASGVLYLADGTTPIDLPNLPSARLRLALDQDPDDPPTPPTPPTTEGQ